MSRREELGNNTFDYDAENSKVRRTVGIIFLIIFVYFFTFNTVQFIREIRIISTYNRIEANIIRGRNKITGIYSDGDKEYKYNINCVISDKADTINLYYKDSIENAVCVNPWTTWVFTYALYFLFLFISIHSFRGKSLLNTIYAFFDEKILEKWRIRRWNKSHK